MHANDIEKEARASVYLFKLKYFFTFMTIHPYFLINLFYHILL